MASVPERKMLLLRHLKCCLPQMKQPTQMTVQELIESSDKFQREFASNTARVRSLIKQDNKESVLTRMINSAYPILHAKALQLYFDYLQTKMEFGTPIEMELYKGMDVLTLVDRMLKKRPRSFYGPRDKCVLRNGEVYYGGFEELNKEKGISCKDGSIFSLNEYLSYDEMRLSALLAVSSESCFVNDGYRKNCGKEGRWKSFEPEGVIVGQVGARLKKPGFMEWQDCVVTAQQNTRSNGYGERGHGLPSIWGPVFSPPEYLPVYDEIHRRMATIPVEQQLSDPLVPYVMLDPKDLQSPIRGPKNFGSQPFYFNKKVFKRRIRFCADGLLAEASARAAEAGKRAYIHVVGLGLGVWKINGIQEQLFVDGWTESLECFQDLSKIAYVDFSWIPVRHCILRKNNEVIKVEDGDRFPGTDVIIHFSKRNLHELLPKPNLLLVCSYAWDGNAYPGNEFWDGKVSSTGDSAAACSSQVAELHNVEINRNVCAAKLRISSGNGLETLEDYVLRLEKETSMNVTPKTVNAEPTVKKNTSRSEARNEECAQEGVSNNDTEKKTTGGQSSQVENEGKERQLRKPAKGNQLVNMNANNHDIEWQTQGSKSSKGNNERKDDHLRNPTEGKQSGNLSAESGNSESSSKKGSSRPTLQPYSSATAVEKRKK